MSFRARLSRVEESTHMVYICSKIDAKILRRASLAQDDNCFVIILLYMML